MYVQRGIALIQVLIISFILSMLGLYIMQSTRDQVKTTYIIKNAMDLRLKIENAEAQVINSLLSEFKYKNELSSNSIVNQWNFYNKPFAVNNVQVQIQDLNGLISLNKTGQNLLYDFLTYLNISNKDQREFVESLSDWKDIDDDKSSNGAERNYYEVQGLPGPRNGYLQSIAEVSYIKKSSVLTKQQFSNYFTVEQVTGFNPSSAPEPILKAFVKDDTKVAKLIELRNNGQLTENNFYSITSIDSDEFVSFLSGSTFTVKLTASVAQQQITKKFTIKLRARSITRPVVITNVMWNINEDYRANSNTQK